MRDTRSHLDIIADLLLSVPIDDEPEPPRAKPVDDGRTLYVTSTAVAPEQKTVRLEIRLGPSEAEMLRELAEHEALPQGAVLRRLVRQAHAAVFGPPPKPEKKTPNKKPKK